METNMPTLKIDYNEVMKYKEQRRKDEKYQEQRNQASNRTLK